MHSTEAKPNADSRPLPPPWEAEGQFHLPLPYLSEFTVTPDVFSILDDQIKHLSEGLEQLAAQSEAMSAVENELSSVVAQLLPELKPQPCPAPVQEQFDFALQVIGFPNTPLYVKHRFNLSFRVISKTEDVCNVGYPLSCVLSVHRMDGKNSEIKKSRSGECYSGKEFLRGELSQVFTEGPIMTFPNLIFTDISSLFPQGRINILVQCLDNPRCKSLFIEGVRVKARKKRPDELI